MSSSLSVTAPKNVLKSAYQVFLAKSFLSSLAKNDIQGNYENTLYLVTSRTEPWASDIAPPTPTDSNNEELFFRRQAFFFKRVTTNNISFVIQGTPWKKHQYYYAYSAKRLEESVVIIRELEMSNVVYSVYLCIESPLDKNRGSVVQPKYNKINPIEYIHGQDGYTWVLLYQLTDDDLYQFSYEEWIPLPVDHRIESGSLQKFIKDNAHRRTVPEYDFNNDFFLNIPINGFGYNLEYQLDATHLMIDLTLRSNERYLSTNVVYRQVGIWLNPMEKASGLQAHKEQYTGSEINLTTGNLLYFENRLPILRNEAQSENFKIILPF